MYRLCVDVNRFSEFNGAFENRFTINTKVLVTTLYRYKNYKVGSLIFSRLLLLLLFILTFLTVLTNFVVRKTLLTQGGLVRSKYETLITFRFATSRWQNTILLNLFVTV